MNLDSLVYNSHALVMMWKCAMKDGLETQSKYWVSKEFKQFKQRHRKKKCKDGLERIKRVLWVIAKYLMEENDIFNNKVGISLANKKYYKGMLDYIKEKAETRST